MSPILIFALCLAMVGTSFLSGIFGMAGGLILIGILLALLPLPEAMMLHGVTQMASNGWRAALWYRYIRWDVAIWYIAGCAIGLLIWSLWRYVPSKPVALIMLGAGPFLLRLMPARIKADPERPMQGLVYGTVCMSLILLTGVAAPVVDAFFLGGKLDRREIVATKAACQVFGHSAKLIYFGSIIDQAASIDPWIAVLAVGASMLGTTLATRVLEGMTDKQFRSWANAIVTVIATYYIGHGAYLLIAA